MSRKHEHTSSEGFCSKPAYILWTIYNSWYSQELPGWNPDRFTLSNLFSSVYWKIELKMILSNILLQIGRLRQAYSYLSIAFHFSLWIETMFDFFQLSGKTPKSIQFWNIIDKALTRESSHNLTILTDISSKPWPCQCQDFW